MFNKFELCSCNFHGFFLHKICGVYSSFKWFSKFDWFFSFSLSPEWYPFLFAWFLIQILVHCIFIIGDVWSILIYLSGEPGLLLGGIPNPALYAEGFYLGGKEMNEKKYVRNAFVEGDAYFNYGDLLYYDKDYFIYFKDRMGDTFRCVTLNLIVRK